MLVASLRDVHANWAWVVIIGNAVAGAWALAAHWVAPLRLRALWWFVGVAQFTVFVQVAMGVAMMTAQGIQPPAFHSFYGFVAIIAVAIIFSYRQTLRPHMYLLYGGGELFLAGLAIRAMLKA